MNSLSLSLFACVAGEQAKWPATVAGYGQIDLAGFPKPAALWYRQNWLRHPNATVTISTGTGTGTGTDDIISTSSADLAAANGATEEAEKLHARIGREVAVIRASRGRMQNLSLSVDVPSPATCTGEKVLLDGRDVALLRISVVDANGVPTNSGGPTQGGINVSLKILSGPGRLVGVGSGDLNTHQRPQGSAIQTDGGLARAVIQVTLDCTSEERLLSKTIDTSNTHGAGGLITTVAAACPAPLPEIVVEATALTKTIPLLPPATVRIQLSGDRARDSVLAVARRSEPCAFSYIDSFAGHA